MSQAAPSTPLRSIDSPGMRGAGRELLSLALMDARNHSLHLMSQFETALAGVNFLVPPWPGLTPPLWLLGHVGWFSEWWIARNLQRQMGARGQGDGARLASIEPLADAWWDPGRMAPTDRWGVVLPELAVIKSYLLATLETTLELLERTPEEDDALYFFRLALFYEDLQSEHLVTMGQILGLPLALPQAGPMVVRPPLLVPATRWRQGSGPHEGFAFDNELPSQTVSVPEFEIDAQPVTWAQYVEFVDDGGYDDESLWRPQGWQWLQEKAAFEGRRGPRYVDQIGVASGAVMQTRFGKAMRMLGNQPAMHVSWWEADAWCRWAGRRLPSEVEWELAGSTLMGRGFRSGDVWEWTGSSFSPYPGFTPGPWRACSEPYFDTHKVLRGGSFATRQRLKHAKFRYFLGPERDDAFTGFRSCAL
jgi:ergothioneine biosynthesis protein EgtB